VPNPINMMCPVQHVAKITVPVTNFFIGTIMVKETLSLLSNNAPVGCQFRLTVGRSDRCTPSAVLKAK
jgi:hypothetical protein